MVESFDLVIERITIIVQSNWPSGIWGRCLTIRAFAFCAILLSLSLHEMLHYQQTCVVFVLVPAAVCRDLLKPWHLFSLFLFFFQNSTMSLFFQCCMLSLKLAWVCSQKPLHISLMFQAVCDGVLSCMHFINDFPWKKWSLWHYHQSPPLVSTLTWEHCAMRIKVIRWDFGIKMLSKKENKSPISECIWVAIYIFAQSICYLKLMVEIWFCCRHKVWWVWFRY